MIIKREETGCYLFKSSVHHLDLLFGELGDGEELLQVYQAPLLVLLHATGHRCFEQITNNPVPVFILAHGGW